MKIAFFVLLAVEILILARLLYLSIAAPGEERIAASWDFVMFLCVSAVFDLLYGLVWIGVAFVRAHR